MEELKEGWRRIKLGEVTDIGSSKRIFMVDYRESGIPFFRGKEIIQKSKGNNITTELYITEEKYNEIKNKFEVPQKGDILLTSVGTIGVPYLVNNNEPFYFKDGNVTWIKKYKNEVYNKYIYQWIKSPLGQNQINQVTIGSTQKALTIDALKKLEIDLPPLETQEKIASILSALDDKIEVNNEMNKTLEEMAQTLFKRWFIDFDFPNENGEPYRSSGGKMVDSELGEIPEGWRVSDIYKISNVIYGAPFKSKQFNEEKKGFPLIRIRDLKTFNPQFFTEENHPKKTLVYPGDLLVGMDAEFRATPWLGKIGVLNQRVCMFSPNKDVVGKYFLKMILEKPLSFFENSKVATTVIHLGKSDVDMIKIICPNDLILEKFKELTECIYKKKINNAQEIQSLTEIRDTLLPKLMSGEVEV